MKLFFDHSSQPSRAVLSFCLINQIPYVLQERRVINGDHLTQQFRKISPLQILPTIQDDDYCLSQSHAIMKYLARKYKVPENWYPQRYPQRVGKIDEYLDFHHSNTRNCAKYTFNKGFLSVIGQRKNNFKFAGKTDKPDFQQLQRNVKIALDRIESHYLGKTQYIASDQISIADLSAYCELKQMDYIDYSFAPYSNICRWQQKISQIAEVKEAHAVFNKIVKKLHEKNHLNQPHVHEHQQKQIHPHKHSHKH